MKTNKNKLLDEYIPWEIIHELSYLNIELSIDTNYYWDIASMYEGERVGNGGVYGVDVYTKCLGIIKKKTHYPAYTYKEIIEWINDSIRDKKTKIKTTTFNTKIENIRDFFLLFVHKDEDRKRLENDPYCQFAGNGDNYSLYRGLFMKYLCAYELHMIRC